MSFSRAIQVAMLLASVSVFCEYGVVHAVDANQTTGSQVTNDAKAIAITNEAETLTTETASPGTSTVATNPSSGPSRTSVLVGSLTVFLLAVFVGVEVITKVPPTLHTPLMSGSNAISGITIVGAILVAGHQAAGGHGAFGSFLGLIAVVLAMINVVGGFLVTHRMLMMFKKR